MDITSYFILLISGLVISMTYQSKYADVEYVESTFDNRKYLVQKQIYSQHAANLLSVIRRDLSRLCSDLNSKYPNDRRCSRLYRKFNPDVIVESDPNSQHTSYSINKGEKIVLCLRSKDGKNRMVKKNVIMFVALHELAHIMTISVGHTKEFWDNFEFLLKEAVRLGIYNHIDFNSDPHYYCGVQITDSPLSK